MPPAVGASADTDYKLRNTKALPFESLPDMTQTFPPLDLEQVMPTNIPPTPTDRDIIYDWNTEGTNALPAPEHKVELYDETLRDGIQSPSALDPPVDVKLEILQAGYRVRRCRASGRKPT